MSSLRGMFTLVGNRGHAGTLSRYLPHVAASSALVPGDSQLLEAAIHSDISSVLTAGAPYHANPLLQHIAVGIHLWGGRAGRGAFTATGGFTVSCPMPAYADMIHLLRTHPVRTALPGGNWPGIYAMKSSFRGIGVAFMTKHLAFWSRAVGSPIELPVLDRVMFQTFVAPGRLPGWVNYTQYVTELEADRATISARPGLAGITISAIERQLFNWAASPAATAWTR